MFRAVSCRIALGLILAGCGGSPSQRSVSERFAHEAALRAKERAPDLYTAALEAEEEAERVEDTDEAAALDLRTRARLLLEAAIAEADRLALEERRLALEEEERALEQAAVRDESASRQVRADLALHEAALVARAQAEAAYTEAVNDEARRSDEALAREAARVLVARAQMLREAAAALGAANQLLSGTDEAIARAEGATRPSDALDAADGAVRAALSALGTTRTEMTSDSRQSLVDTAQEMGFSTEQRDEGLAVGVDRVFGARGTQLGAAARRKLEHLAALARAHPTIPLQVQAYANDRATSAAARADAVERLLIASGIDSERVQTAGLVVATETDDVTLLFLGVAPQIGSP